MISHYLCAIGTYTNVNKRSQLGSRKHVEINFHFEKIFYVSKTSLQFVVKGPIDNNLALVYHPFDHKPLFEPIRILIFLLMRHWDSLS